VVKAEEILMVEDSLTDEEAVDVVSITKVGNPLKIQLVIGVVTLTIGQIIATCHPIAHIVQKEVM
jgi:hypothetical protein